MLLIRYTHDSVLLYYGDKDDWVGIGVYELETHYTFKRVFENRFIYGFFGLFVYPNVNDLDSTLAQIGLTKEELFYYVGLGRYDLSGKSRAKEFYKKQEVKNRLLENGSEGLWNAARSRKQLYDLICSNTLKGEAVEIYTDVVRSLEGRFGPPKKTKVFDLEDVLTTSAFGLGKIREKTQIWNTD